MIASTSLSSRSFARDFCHRRLTGLLWVSLLVSGPVTTPNARAAEVLTQHNDQWRTGSNLKETILSPATVSPQKFGKLFSYPVDGEVYAQPLVVENLAIKGGAHNVVYIATMQDSVYAFDADRNVNYWHVSFTGGNITTVPIADITGNNFLNIHWTVGILSTPVIDRDSNTLYVLVRTKNTLDSTYHQHLHALDLATGAEKFGGPSEIIFPGFDPKLQSQRSALALSNGYVYIAWASHEDIGPYHGYVMSYNASTLKLFAIFNATRSGSQGGIWQAGQAPAIDEVGNLYFMTGNGDWNGTTNFGSSFVRLSTTLRVMDWFTPQDFMDENAIDLDLGSSGALLLPSAAGYPATTYVVGGGKQGRLFVLDKNRGMGRITPGDVGAHQIFQATQTTACSHHIHGSPVYWRSQANGQMLYLWGENDVAKGFLFDGSTFATTPLTTTLMRSPEIGCGMPGAMLSVSAQGDTGGILWANCVASGDALHDIVPGVLRAFDANNLGRELWNSRMNAPVNDTGLFAKYVSPTVANGKVYMASFSYAVHVFGLLDSGSTVDSLLSNNHIFKIINRATGGALDNFGSPYDGSAVGQSLSAASPNQQWLVTNISGSIYKFSGVTGGRYLDSLGQSTDGSNVGQWVGHPFADQQWTVTKTAGGYYKLTSLDYGKNLDTGGHPADGSPVQLWSDSASLNQQWQFVAP